MFDVHNIIDMMKNVIHVKHYSLLCDNRYSTSTSFMKTERCNVWPLLPYDPTVTTSCDPTVTASCDPITTHLYTGTG